MCRPSDRSFDSILGCVFGSVIVSAFAGCAVGPYVTDDGLEERPAAGEEAGRGRQAAHAATGLSALTVCAQAASRTSKEKTSKREEGKTGSTVKEQARANVKEKATATANGR